MSEADSERLLTEALHAQAARTPLPDPSGPITGYGLISGSDLPLMVTEREATQPRAPERPRTSWVLLLALLLGLAAGSVVGLLSLL
ncbi:MAG: hypothetical protein M3548_23665 [Actinomycetota bacterium]|nr:hypothetical protein [Actinomycetota bacterium]